MALELYTPTKDDIPEIVHIGFDAYSDDALTSSLYPQPAPPDLISQNIETVTKTYGQNANHNELTVKDLETGKIISWMQFDFIPEPTKDDWNVFHERPCPPGWNEDFFRTVVKQSWQSKIDAMGRQPYIYLSTLVTPPEHRKRGAGSLLLKALLEFQETVNLPIYLISTPAGASLYPKFGFKEVSRYKLDTSATNSNIERINIGMLRPAPRPSEAPRLPQLTQPISSADDIIIKPLTTLAEHIAMRAIRSNAFHPNELMTLAFASQSTASSPETLATKQHHDAQSNPRHRWLGAFSRADETLLAVTHWYFVDDPSITHYPHGPPLDPANPWPPGTNIPLAEVHFGRAKKLRESYMKDKKYAYCALCVVDSGAQRKGVGRRLLEETLREVDALEWEAWIEATPAGMGLYKRMGWEVVELVRTDLREFGGSTIAEDAVMIRPAQKNHSG